MNIDACETISNRSTVKSIMMSNETVHVSEWQFIELEHLLE